MNNLALILAGVSAVVAVGSIVRHAFTACHDKKYWAKEMTVWRRSSRSSELDDIIKPREWLKQHNDGPNPCDDRYPTFVLQDFSTGVTLVVRRKEYI